MLGCRGGDREKNSRGRHDVKPTNEQSVFDFLTFFDFSRSSNAEAVADRGGDGGAQ